MKALELKVPPALLMLLFLWGMWVVDGWLPQFKQAWPWHEWAARVAFFTATCLIVAGAYSFRRAQTTVDPTRPSLATSVVTTGVYGFSRNPMYFGFLMILLGLVFKLTNPILLAGLPVFVLYMNRFQIEAEERALHQLFGEEYLLYCQRVRRWI